jgi:hypothetical protein
MTTKIQTTNINDGAITSSKIGSVNINALSDVNTVSSPPSNGQTLVWNAFTNQWEPGTIAGGTGDTISPFMLAGM